MFEDSDDDEHVKASNELEDVGSTVTMDAAELNQLMRRACAFLGGVHHQRADQTVGILIVAHCTRLLPTLWTVLLQKLKECDNTQSKVSVVSHFANLCDRIAARQRSEAFRVFCREATILFTQLDVVADRRFLKSCQTIFVALGIHAHADAATQLYEKLTTTFFKSTRQDAKRHAGLLLVSLCRWTPARTVAAAVFEHRENGDRAGLALLTDIAALPIVEQSRLLHVDCTSAAEVERLIKFSSEWLCAELENTTSSLVVASLASALCKLSVQWKIDTDVTDAALRLLQQSTPKAMLVCPVLQLVRASTSQREDAFAAAKLFLNNNDALIRQNAFDLLGHAARGCGKPRQALDVCLAHVNERLVVNRCAITVKGLFACVSLCLPLVSRQDFVDVAVQLIDLFAWGESRGARMPAAREQLLAAIALGLREFGCLLNAAEALPLARFASRRESLLAEPASASWAARILLALPQAFATATLSFDAASFACEGAVLPNEWSDDIDDCFVMMCSTLLDVAEDTLSCGTSSGIAVGAALLREVADAVRGDAVCMRDLTTQYVGVASSILVTLNSPAAASVESVVLLLRALREVLPLGPEEDGLADAFRMVWTMLRRCCRALEPPAPTSSDAAKPAAGQLALQGVAGARAAGTLLEEVRLVDEIADGIDAAARTHQAGSEDATIFRELVGELLQTTRCISRAAHGFFRDALQLQIMPVMAALELTALLQPAEAINCAGSLLTALFSDPSKVVRSERVNEHQRRVKVVQAALPTLQRALAFDLHVVGPNMFEFISAAAACDRACSSKELSCFLALDPECGLLRRLAAIAVEDRSYSFVHGPVMLSSLMSMLATVKQNCAPLLPNDVLDLMNQTVLDVEARSVAFCTENGGDSFLALFSTETPPSITSGASAVPARVLRALAVHKPDRLETVLAACAAAESSTAASRFVSASGAAPPSIADVREALVPMQISSILSRGSVTPVDAALRAAASQCKWDVVAALFRSLASRGLHVNEMARHEVMRASGCPDDATVLRRWFRRGQWSDPLFGESIAVQESERDTAAIAVALASKSVLSFTGGEPPIAAASRASSSAPQAATAEPDRASKAAVGFVDACDSCPYAGSVLAALPLHILEAEYERLQPYHVLEALRYVSAADELELWLAAASALGGDISAHWRHLIVLQAGRRCLTTLSARQARSDNVERTSAIVEFLASIENPPREVGVTIAALVEWLKPDRMGFWCWDDAWSEVPSDLKASVLRCLAISVGFTARGSPGPSTDAALAKHLAERLLRYDRDACAFADSATLIACRCLSGTVAHAFLHHSEISLANPRVFNAVTELIYTVGINNRAALEFHQEITPMLIDQAVTEDIDFREAVLRCCTALIVSLGEERRLRPPAHTATSDLQALYGDYPLKRMSTEGAEAIFDAVHDATFAPWARADMSVRHWNQFRRPSLVMTPAENTIEPQLRDRLCTSILNLVVPMLQKQMSPAADVLEVWNSFSLVQVLATKCAGALRKSQLLHGTAAKELLTTCVAFASSQLPEQLRIVDSSIKLPAVSGNAALTLGCWCGLPLSVEENDFYDTATASALLIVFSAGLRSSLDSDDVKAATNSAVVVRSTIRNDWLNLGGGLCALNGFASGPKADQAVAAKFFADKVTTIIEACNKAPLVLSSGLLQTLRTAFAFAAAMPYETFVPDLARSIWTNVIINPHVTSLRVRAYAHFALQSIIGLQGVGSASASNASFGAASGAPAVDDDHEAQQWAALRANLQESSKEFDIAAAMQGEAAAYFLHAAGAADNPASSTAAAGTKKAPAPVPRTMVDTLLATTTRVSFLLRALGTNVEGDEKDRTLSSVIDLHSALRLRPRVDAPTQVVVLRLLKEAMAPSERMFLALNQFCFTDIGLAGTVDALEGTAPSDSAELLAHLNLVINSVSQHAQDEGQVWWIAGVVVWMASAMIDRHLHRALGRSLTIPSNPAARKAMARAASTWLVGERAALHRSVISVFDSGAKANAAAVGGSNGAPSKRTEAWRAVAAGLRR